MTRKEFLKEAIKHEAEAIERSKKLLDFYNQPERLNDEFLTGPFWKDNTKTNLQHQIEDTEEELTYSTEMLETYKKELEEIEAAEAAASENKATAKENKKKTVKKPTERPFFSNNDRRRAGLPTRRKSNKDKRYKTRCEAIEAISAFLDFCDGENSHSYHR